jgi:hypothetical protein
VELKSTYTRDELLALRPSQYLAEGFRNAAGGPRPELNGICATASALRLHEQQVAPAELRITYEAWKQVPEGQGESIQQQARASLSEALEIARGVMNQPNHPGLVEWLLECIDQLRAAGDLPLLLDHLLAVTKQSGVLLALGGPTP